MKKSLLIGLSTTAVTIGIVGLAAITSAQTSAGSNASLIDKIAMKFNLKKADVQAVFDADRAQHETDRTAKVKVKLDAAVKVGTITQAQEDQLIAKQTELHTYLDTLKDKTEEERRAAMKAKMDEFRQWASDNKIPVSLLEGMRGGHGENGGMPSADARLQPTNGVTN